MFGLMRNIFPSYKPYKPHPYHLLLQIHMSLVTLHPFHHLILLYLPPFHLIHPLHHPALPYLLPLLLTTLLLKTLLPAHLPPHRTSLLLPLASRLLLCTPINPKLVHDHPIFVKIPNHGFPLTLTHILPTPTPLIVSPQPLPVPTNPLNGRMLWPKNTQL